MQRWLCLFALAILASHLAVLADEAAPTYYVQLVRGNNEDQPPAPGIRLIGPKLSKSLHSVFRWKSYWEVGRRTVAVAAGAKTKVFLSKERTVEIDLSQPMKRKITAVSNGVPVCCTTQTVGEGITVIGADRDPASAWFVVVRRDKPTID